MAYSYKEQLEILKPIKLKEGQALRIDCPFCGGYNSFGISRDGGVVKWGCFKASCASHGRKDVGYTRDGVRFKLGYGDKIRATTDQPEINIPNPLVSVAHHPDVLAYLHKVHAIRALNEGLADITYSPTEDRVMFKIPDQNGYTGRSLHQNGPKWKKFGDTSSVYHCGKGTIGVIVEDAPSACAVGVTEGLTGIALLGTMLTSQHKTDLRHYKQLIVCLDPDAAIKSILLAKRLSGISNTSVKLIKDDLKYYEPDDIRKMLCV
jgi:hypothetical protein